MTNVVLAVAFFVGIHVFISGTSLRSAIVARLGENGFRGLFSLLSLAGIWWMASAYAGSPELPLWQPALAARLLAPVLVLLAFLFVVIGLGTPSPTVVGGESLLAGDRDSVHGIVRITRHPFLWGVALWAAAHLLVNGDAASLVFFGGFLLLALIGPLLIDRKRKAALGEAWNRFAQATSNAPFVAIASGRNRLVLREVGALRAVAALALFAIFLAAHRWLFGVCPLP